MTAIAEWKQNAVKELRKKIESYPTVAVIDMTNLPAQQLQVIRSKIRDKVIIQMTRKRLIVKALEESNKKEATKLVKHIKGLPALLFSNESAFELFRVLKENMSDAPAKEGQEAPSDIMIKAGPTNFPAGPIISELQGLGIKSGIENGKIVIKQDKLLINQGDKITKQQAALISRLGMKPMKIGIDLISALEGADVFLKEILNIDIEDYKNKVQEAYQNTFKLSVALGFITKENIEYLISKAHNDSKKLALGAEIVTDETKEELMKKAEAQVKALKEKVGDIKFEEAPKEEPKQEEKPAEEEKKEEPKQEKKEEAKEEVKKETMKEKSETDAHDKEPSEISEADLDPNAKHFGSLTEKDEAKPEVKENEENKTEE